MYEIHITTNNIPKDEYVSLMEKIGIKCAVLLLDNGEMHQMTSVRTKDSKDTPRIIKALKDFGLDILRVKVECCPEPDEKFRYLEAHFDGIVKLLPYAVNIVKQNPILSSTARSHTMSLEDFIERVNQMADLAGLPHPEIEGIIFDDNENLDSLWMGNLECL